MLNSTPCADVNEALSEYLAALEREFGAELLSVYLLGSLSTGSYTPGWSDVNGVIITREDEVTRLETRLDRTLQTVPAPRRLLFDSIVPQAALQREHWHNYAAVWGLINQTNLVEDGLLIWGAELRDELERPNLEELRAYQISELVTLMEGLALPWHKTPRRGLPLREPTADEWNYYHQHPTRIVDWLVYPTRVLLAWDKGRIGSKSEAVNHYIEEYHGPWEPVLLQADTLRRAGALELLTAETLALFSRQTPGLFAWVVKRLLTILFLPGDLPEAARNLRRWLEGDPTVHVPRRGETFQIFIPNRKPWLKQHNESGQTD